jgi:GH24 family phage-related lysozyme (muramidase)
MQFCKLTEKLELEAYPDPVNEDGLPITNGAGSTRNREGQPWLEGEKITDGEALWLLRRDVTEAYAPMPTTPHWNTMTAHQRAALADLNFNEGYTYGDGDHDSLDLALKMREYGRVGKILQLYDNNDELGLSRRRFAEWLIFNESLGAKEAYFTAWAMDSVAAIIEAIA